MQAVAWLLLAGLVCGSGRQLQQQSNLMLASTIDSDMDEQQGFDTVFALGGSQTGGVQITGMLQNFALDQDPVNMLLNRPRTSYLDVSWSNWVDQRLELLDIFQDMIAASRPQCPHMQGSTSSLNSGMVSYLASSRFGPAIMTTYADQDMDDQVEFDYDDVNIPASRMERSYEDAFLQDEMSADADKAFAIAALESKISSKQPNLGYFGANMKNQELYGALDGDSESLQPVILAHPNLLEIVERPLAAKVGPEAFPQEDTAKDVGDLDPKQLALFVLLLCGCCYVWISLLISCIRLRKEEKERLSRDANAESALIKPFEHEGAETLKKVQIASDYCSPRDSLSRPLLS